MRYAGVVFFFTIFFYQFVSLADLPKKPSVSSNASENKTSLSAKQIDYFKKAKTKNELKKMIDEAGMTDIFSDIDWTDPDSSLPDEVKGKDNIETLKKDLEDMRSGIAANNNQILDDQEMAGYKVEPELREIAKAKDMTVAEIVDLYKNMLQDDNSTQEMKDASTFIGSVVDFADAKAKGKKPTGDFIIDDEVIERIINPDGLKKDNATSMGCNISQSIPLGTVLLSNNLNVGGCIIINRDQESKKILVDLDAMIKTNKK